MLLTRVVAYNPLILLKLCFDKACGEPSCRYRKVRLELSSTSEVHWPPTHAHAAGIYCRCTFLMTSYACGDSFTVGITYAYGPYNEAEKAIPMPRHIFVVTDVTS